MYSDCANCRWDSGGNLGEFEGHSKRVVSCSFKPSRPFRIASCGEDFVVNYYEGPPFKFKASHRCAEHQLLSVPLACWGVP